MSLTINPQITSAWKRINIHYISLAAGLTIAVVAAIGVGASERREAVVPSNAHRAAPRIITRDVPLPELTIYLVESQEQANHVRQKEDEAVSVRLQLDMREPPFAPMILVIDTPEAAERALVTIAGVHADGDAAQSFAAHTVDMRGR